MKVGNLTAKRDFSDVRDIVRAYALLGERGEGLYTLGSGKSYSIQFILDQLIEISGLKVDVQRDMARMRGPEVEELYCDYSKAAQEVNWVPSISLRTSLEEVYAYWCEQSDLPMVA
jgi:GDP-4-dehydro-6-deoxy-D-mannose reductase